MSQFRSKQVEVEAETVNRIIEFSKENWKELPEWIRTAYESGDIVFTPGCVHIKTREGTMVGRSGDWIIKGTRGELYPCKPDVFVDKYECIQAPSV